MTPELEDIITAILAAKTKPIPEARRVIRAIIVRNQPSKGTPHDVHG